METKEKFAKEYLEDYIEGKLDKLNKKLGGFYAFNVKRFEEQADRKIKYKNMGLGFYLPANNVKKYYKKYENIIKKGIKKDKRNHTSQQIIWRECSNFEVQYSNDLFTVITNLKGYGYSEQHIRNEYESYLDYCLKNDLI